MDLEKAYVLLALLLAALALAAWWATGLAPAASG